MAKKKARRKKKDPRQVATGLVRLSLPNILKPIKFDDDDKPEYMTTVLVPKADKETRIKLRNAIKLAEKETFPKGRPKKFIYPLVDGKRFAQDKELEVDKYKDYEVFKAKSREEWPPVVVGPNPKNRFTMDDAHKVYSGCNAKILVRATGYDNKSKGVGLYMSMVQILPGGEKLIATLDPDEVFDVEEDFNELEDEFDGDDLDELEDEDLDEDEDDDLSF